MHDNRLDKLVPFNLDLLFRPGLGRRLLLFFFGLSMTPMVLIGILTKEEAKGYPFSKPWERSGNS